MTYVPPSKSVYDRQLKAFLDYGKPIRVFMLNGIGLSGRLLEFDEETLLLEAERGHMPVMIERNGILSIMLADANSSYQRHNGVDVEAAVTRQVAPA